MSAIGTQSVRAKPGQAITRVLLAIYFLALVYIVSAGLYSITRQVFWPEADVNQVASDDCDASLRVMFEQLEARAHSNESVSARLTWLADWDAERLSLHAACGPSTQHSPAYEALYRARYAIANQRNTAEVDARLREVRDAIGERP